MSKRIPKGSFHVFHQTWWKHNPEWPNGLEPCAGRKTTINWFQTEESARAACKQWNSEHDPGVLSRKAGYDVV